ncbi:uncharacterized protein [Gossypium hirsutum]|uniref:DNA/RNA polymerases superfamily protein n=1 Tax=Gossypium hirsutum TaxID=3635 RepID=A0ABM2YMW7_GOSHI|nr:uncharacterized protein LOC121205013 [Gossypium hirsutum]
MDASYVDAWRREFLNLSQRDKSVVEYKAEFLRLSRHARGMVATEYERCVRFEDGLRDSLRFFIAPERDPMLIVGNAIRVTAGKGLEHPPRGVQQPPRCHGQARGETGLGRGQRAPGSGASHTKARQPTLVYAARHREDEDAPNVICTFFIYNVPYTTLIDIGSTHSYIACNLSETLGILVESTMSEGFEEYLTYIGAFDSRVSSVKDIRIIKGFLDIFPDEILRLPPNREVEFRIELLLGTAPVSITSYRMAPKELVELKAQIQELLDHGFIRPRIRVDPQKIEAVLDWKPPKTISKIHSFVGLTHTQQESFEKLKKLLIEARVLIQPEYGKEFTVYSDSSHVGLGDPHFMSQFWKKLDKSGYKNGPASLKDRWHVTVTKGLEFESCYVQRCFILLLVLWECSSLAETLRSLKGVQIGRLRDWRRDLQSGSRD